MPFSVINCTCVMASFSLMTLSALMRLSPVMFFCAHVITLEYGWTDFHEIWCRSYAIEDRSKLVLFNFLHSVIPTWRMLKVLRWENDHLWWRHYTSCCRLSVAVWIIRADIFQLHCKLLMLHSVIARINCTFHFVCLSVTSISRTCCHLSVAMWTVIATICQWSYELFVQESVSGWNCYAFAVYWIVTLPW
jgi:hypothetical protein